MPITKGPYLLTRSNSIARYKSSPFLWLSTSTRVTGVSYFKISTNPHRLAKKVFFLSFFKEADSKHCAKYCTIRERALICWTQSAHIWRQFRGLAHVAPAGSVGWPASRAVLRSARIASPSQRYDRYGHTLTARQDADRREFVITGHPSQIYVTVSCERSAQGPAQSRYERSAQRPAKFSYERSAQDLLLGYFP